MITRSQIAIKSFPISRTWCHAFSKLDQNENRFVLYTIVPGCSYLQNKLNLKPLWIHLNLTLVSPVITTYLFDRFLYQLHTRRSLHYPMYQHNGLIRMNNTVFNYYE